MMMRGWKYKANLQFIMGSAAAVMAVITPVNLTLFTPLAAVVVFLSARFLNFSNVSLLLIFVLGGVVVSSIIGASSSNSLAVEMLAAVILLLILSLTSCKEEFFRGFMYIFAITAVIDVLVNVATWFYQFDILGRPLDYRPGDFLPRFNGLYGHSFASVSVCISGFFASLFLNKNRLALFFICVLPLTGSMRASLAAVYLLALIVLGLFIQRRWKYIVSYVALLAGALLSVALLVDPDGLRFLAWGFGLAYFLENWLLGYPGFIDEPINEGLGVSIDYLISNGNFESMLLNLGAHFGVLVVIVISFLLLSCFRSALCEPRRAAYMIFVGYLIFDIFLGNFLSFIPTAIFSGIVLGRLAERHSYNGVDLTRDAGRLRLGD